MAQYDIKINDANSISGNYTLPNVMDKKTSMACIPLLEYTWGNYVNQSQKYIVIHFPKIARNIISLDIYLTSHTYGQAIYHVEGEIAESYEWNEPANCYSFGVTESEVYGQTFPEMTVRFFHTATESGIVIGDGITHMYNTGVVLRNFTVYGTQREGVDILNDYKTGWVIEFTDDISTWDTAVTVDKTIWYPQYKWNGGNVTNLTSFSNTVEFMSYVDFSMATRVDGLDTGDKLLANFTVGSQIQSNTPTSGEGLDIDTMNNIRTKAKYLIYQQNRTTSYMFPLAYQQISRNMPFMEFADIVDTGAGLIRRSIQFCGGLNYGFASDETGLLIYGTAITGSQNTFVIPSGAQISIYGR